MLAAATAIALHSTADADDAEPLQRDTDGHRTTYSVTGNLMFEMETLTDTQNVSIEGLHHVEMAAIILVLGRCAKKT